MQKKNISFEKIDFNFLTCIRYKKERQIFFHDSEPYVYKFFTEGWEFADKTEQGINCGYYDYQLIPNFIGLIKNKKNSNRGYVCKRFNESQVLVNYPRRNSIKTILKKYVRQEISLKNLLMPQYKPKKQHLIELLFSIFSKSLRTGVIFTELNPIHVWTDNKGYYILDLDSLRELDWLFCQDRNDPEFMRKIGNCNAFNRGLRELIEFHGLKYPFKINQYNKIIPFWQSFIQVNKLAFHSLNLANITRNEP